MNRWEHLRAPQWRCGTFSTTFLPGSSSSSPRHGAEKSCGAHEQIGLGPSPCLLPPCGRRQNRPGYAGQRTPAGQHPAGTGQQRGTPADQILSKYLLGSNPRILGFTAAGQGQPQRPGFHCQRTPHRKPDPRAALKRVMKGSCLSAPSPGSFGVGDRQNWWDCNVHPAKLEVRLRMNRPSSTTLGRQCVRLQRKNIAPKLSHPTRPVEPSRAAKPAVQAMLRWQPETWEYRPGAQGAQAESERAAYSSQTVKYTPPPAAELAVAEEIPRQVEPPCDALEEVRTTLLKGGSLVSCIKPTSSGDTPGAVDFWISTLSRTDTGGAVP